MEPKLRIAICRLTEKIQANQAYADQLGIADRSYYKETSAAVCSHDLCSSNTNTGIVSQCRMRR